MNRKAHFIHLLVFIVFVWLGLEVGPTPNRTLAEVPPRSPLGADGDGHGDLAVGVPGEEIGASQNAGALNLLYSTPGGLIAPDNQLWDQDSTDILDDAEPNDELGRALTGGDFNGDGYADLAVGVPFEDVAVEADAGAVNVIYGSAVGLSAANNQIWHQNSTGVEGDAESNDGFGTGLIGADFNNDGYADLAVGVPSEQVAGAANAGAVNVLYGSASGLSAANNQVWHQDSPDIEDDAEPNDGFGSALTGGDFNGDGYADLAIGVPFEEVAGMANAGAVNVLYGSASGLSAANNQVWHQDSTDIEDDAEPDDEFGSALTDGDFNGDGYADLAVGVPLEDLLAGADAGAVTVLYGSAVGLSATNNQVWHQDSPDVEEDAEPNDEFGSALTGSDFDGDGYADLAIGAPFEDVLVDIDAGAVNVLYGSSSGLSAANNQVWHQAVPGILGAAEPNDRFGHALAACHFDGGGYADLAVGLPSEEIGGAANAGAVNVLYGAIGGLSASGNQLWQQNSSGIPGIVAPDDNFGWSLACLPVEIYRAHLPLIMRNP